MDVFSCLDASSNDPKMTRRKIQGLFPAVLLPADRLSAKAGLRSGFYPPSPIIHPLARKYPRRQFRRIDQRIFLAKIHL
jgi:hypothetical protein